MRMYDVISQLFTAAEDAKMIQDRKSAFLDLTAQGYLQPVLVYPKGNVKEVRIHSMAIPSGFSVIEVVKRPHSRDGYVLCIHQ